MSRQVIIHFTVGEPPYPVRAACGCFPANSTLHPGKVDCITCRRTHRFQAAVMENALLGPIYIGPPPHWAAQK